MESNDSLVEAIDAFNGSVIIVTHSEMMLHALATRLIVFDDGKQLYLKERTRTSLTVSAGKVKMNPARRGLKRLGQFPSLSIKNSSGVSGQSC